MYDAAYNNHDNIAAVNSTGAWTVFSCILFRKYFTMHWRDKRNLPIIYQLVCF